MRFNCESGTLPCCGLLDSSNLLGKDRRSVASLTGSMDEVIIQTRRQDSCKGGNLFVRVGVLKDSVFIDKLRKDNT